MESTSARGSWLNGHSLARATSGPSISTMRARIREAGCCEQRSWRTLPCACAAVARRRDLELVLRIVLGVRQAAAQREDKGLVAVHRERLLDFRNSYRWDSVDRQLHEMLSTHPISGKSVSICLLISESTGPVCGAIFPNSRCFALQ
jgi:hypothetical protein